MPLIYADPKDPVAQQNPTMDERRVLALLDAMRGDDALRTGVPYCKIVRWSR